MELAKNAPSIWPGYVAAVASLVLSLLLLLAILVFAMTQVGSIVSNYMQEVVKNSWLAEQAQAALAAQPVIARPRPSAPAPRPVFPDAPVNAPALTRAQTHEAVPASSRPVARSIQLVFSPHVDSLTTAQRQQLANAIKQLNAPENSKWQITSTVLESDPLMEKTSYRMLLLSREVLLAQAVSAQNIQVQLVPSEVPPPGYQRGETVVRLVPVDAAPNDARQP